MGILTIQGLSVPCERVFLSVRELWPLAEPDSAADIKKGGHGKEELEKLMVIDRYTPESLKVLQDSLVHINDMNNLVLRLSIGTSSSTKIT